MSAESVAWASPFSRCPFSIALHTNSLAPPFCLLTALRYYGDLQAQEPHHVGLQALLRRLFHSHTHLVDDLLENFLEGRSFNVVGAKPPVASPVYRRRQFFQT